MTEGFRQDMARNKKPETRNSKKWDTHHLLLKGRHRLFCAPPERLVSLRHQGAGIASCVSSNQAGVDR